MSTPRETTLPPTRASLPTCALPPARATLWTPAATPGRTVQRPQLPARLAPQKHGHRGPSDAPHPFAPDSGWFGGCTDGTFNHRSIFSVVEEKAAADRTRQDFTATGCVLEPTSRFPSCLAVCSSRFMNNQASKSFVRSSATPKFQAMASAIRRQAFPSPYGFTARAILV